MVQSSNKNLRISAVITAYNCAAFVGDAIESVLAQTHSVDEIVVIDDGSSDETAAVVARYAAAGVRYVYQNNQGAGAARNRGVRETTGELIAFLDGDDLWLPEKTAHQLAYLDEHPDVALVSGHQWWWNVSDNKRWIQRYGVKAGISIAREILIHNVVGNPSMVLLRRSILDQTGLFDTSLRWGQDWELFIRIVARAKVAFLAEPVITYRWHPDNISHKSGWERLTLLLGISRRAIASFKPAWWRPILLARALSKAEFHRARYAYNHEFRRRQQIKHALFAICAYPLEDTLEKAKLMVRVMIGKAVYNRLRKQLKMPDLRRQTH